MNYAVLCIAAVIALSPTRASADTIFKITPNGAVNRMTVVDESWDGIKKGMMPGSIIFSGTLDRNNMLSGKAYAFKFGCAPAPYAFDVKGTYYPSSGDVELYGAAPAFADDSCRVLHYSDTLVDSHLSLQLLHIVQSETR